MISLLYLPKNLLIPLSHLKYFIIFQLIASATNIDFNYRFKVIIHLDCQTNL